MRDALLMLIGLIAVTSALVLVLTILLGDGKIVLRWWRTLIVSILAWVPWVGDV
jgi:hypothetical protein